MHLIQWGPFGWQGEMLTYNEVIISENLQIPLQQYSHLSPSLNIYLRLHHPKSIIHYYISYYILYDWLLTNVLPRSLSRESFNLVPYTVIT